MYLVRRHSRMRSSELSRRVHAENDSQLTEMPRMTTPKLLRVSEVAERLNCAVSTVYSLIESGCLGHHRCPGVRISEGQLASYLEETRQGTGTAGENVDTAGRRPPRPRLKHIRL